MDWYVLFVKTGQEQKVVKLISKQLNDDILVPFIPLKEGFFKWKGTVKKELKPLFPSYVFIESGLPKEKFIETINTFIYESDNIIDLLKYSDIEIAMRETEKQRLLDFYNDDYCIQSSSGIIEGDIIHIIDGPLKGLESIVKKVNRHKRQAWVEMEFMGDTRIVSVALEIVKKYI